MAADRQLSGDFWLHEFPCYERATEADVAALEETVARVLQPARARWGRIRPTSWMWWSDGCTPRTGPHAGGGTVDFVALDAPTRDVYEWGRQYLLPSGYIGRWIYEPERSAAEGTPQGEHIHMAPLADMLEHGDVVNPGRILALEETTEGSYVVRSSYTDGAGTALDPIELPGFTVRRAGPGLFGFLLFVGLVFNLAWTATPRTPSR